MYGASHINLRVARGGGTEKNATPEMLKSPTTLTVITGPMFANKSTNLRGTIRSLLQNPDNRILCVSHAKVRFLHEPGIRRRMQRTRKDTEARGRNPSPSTTTSIRNAYARTTATSSRASGSIGWSSYSNTSCIPKRIGSR
jgi:hypothetical protein